MLDLDAIKRRLFGQHPGPWKSDEDFYDNAIKPLVAEVVRLRAELVEATAQALFGYDPARPWDGLPGETRAWYREQARELRAKDTAGTGR